MIEEHTTEDGTKITFDTRLAIYLSHKDVNKCIIIVSGIAVTIMASYETMKVKKTAV